MRVVVLGSICPRARRQAVAELLSTPGRTVLRYDRTGTCLNRFAQGRGVAAIAGFVQTLPVDGPAIGADLRDIVLADLPVALHQLSGAAVDEVVVVLPEGMDVAIAVAGLAGGGRLAVVASVALALDPATMEDTLWASGTLSEAGLASCAKDLRTPGDFLVGNLLWADTVAMIEGSRLGAGQAAALLGHLAPAARVMHLTCRRFAWAGFDPREVQARTRPGAVCLPAEARNADGVVSGLITAARPLHPARLLERMPAITAGAVFSRGKAWVASVPERRIAWWGVGPEVGFDDGGRWLSPVVSPPADAPTQDALDWRAGSGDRSTAIAFTGRDLDLARLGVLLDECVLDEAEDAALSRGELVIEDPLDLDRALASSDPVSDGDCCGTRGDGGSA